MKCRTNYREQKLREANGSTVYILKFMIIIKCFSVIVFNYISVFLSFHNQIYFYISMLNYSLYVLLYRIPCACKSGQGCLCMSDERLRICTKQSIRLHTALWKNIWVNIENIAHYYRRKDILLRCPLCLSMWPVICLIYMKPTHHTKQFYMRIVL